ncbi:MSMP protein, partial [Chloroceryle aenea]|nr:MSMP protein [Chloroceryle aenea]
MQVQKMGCAWGRLCLLLSLLFQLLVSQDKCYFQAKGADKHKEKQFSLGKSWLSTSCLLCAYLHPTGVDCSSHHYIDFPSLCEAHYNSQTCQISVVQKASPSLPCVKSTEHEQDSASTPEPLS